MYLRKKKHRRRVAGNHSFASHYRAQQNRGNGQHVVYPPGSFLCRPRTLSAPTTSAGDPGQAQHLHSGGPGVDRAGRPDQPRRLSELIGAGHVDVEPLVYEDFLPVSTAGIFQSNLRDAAQSHYAINPNQAAFEKALGRQARSPRVPRRWSCRNWGKGRMFARRHYAFHASSTRPRYRANGGHDRQRRRSCPSDFSE